MPEYMLTGETIEDSQIKAMLDEEVAGPARPFAIEILQAALLPDGKAQRISRRAARDLAARTWNLRNKAI